MNNSLKKVSGHTQIFFLFPLTNFHCTPYFYSEIGLERGSFQGSISSTTIYNKIIVKIEHFSELTHFILMKMSPVAIMVPAMIGTYFKYYVLGLGDASFPYLPFA